MFDSLPIGGKSAFECGSPYYRGRPCKRLHDGLRYTKGGACVQCTREGSARSRGADPASVIPRADRVAKRTQALGSTYIPASPCRHGHLLRWVSTNNCVECDKAGRKRHKLSGKFARIKREYGISRESYLALVRSQNSRCAICLEKHDDHFLLHVDHCHDTGLIRGLLCQRCNQAIGLMRDKPELMLSAARYLS